MALGVGVTASTVYWAIQRNPGCTVDDIVGRVGIERSRVIAALEALADLEIDVLESVEDDTLSAPPPHRVIDGLIQRRERELQEHFESLRRTRGHASIWLNDYLAEHRVQVADGLDFVTGLEPVRALVRVLTEAATSSMVNVMPLAPEPDAILASAGTDQLVMEKGLSAHTIMPASVRRDPVKLAAVRASVARGVVIRLHPAPPMKCIIFDGTTAIVPIDPTDVGNGAWVVRTEGLLQPIRLLVETAWAQAAPVDHEQDEDDEDLADGEQAPGRKVDASEVARIREVFRLLAQGQKDDTLGRRLKISVRTVRRLVADGMTMLGAKTRFEAGVQAQRRGWLD